jgi:hypothetical protein
MAGSFGIQSRLSMIGGLLVVTAAEQLLHSVPSACLSSLWVSTFQQTPSVRPTTWSPFVPSTSISVAVKSSQPLSVPGHVFRYVFVGQTHYRYTDHNVLVENLGFGSKVPRVPWWLHHFLGTHDGNPDDRVSTILLFPYVHVKVDDTNIESTATTSLVVVMCPFPTCITSMACTVTRPGMQQTGAVLLLSSSASRLHYQALSTASLSTRLIYLTAVNTCKFALAILSTQQACTTDLMMLMRAQFRHWLYLLFRRRRPFLLGPHALVSAYA